MRDAARADTRKSTPFNPAGVQSKYTAGPSTTPKSVGLVQRGMPKAESFGKEWGGNVGSKAYAGQGQGKPGKNSRDVGAWGGNVGKHVTRGKPSVGAASP